MVVDALVPWIAKASTAMALNIQDRQIIVFHKEGFLSIKKKS